MEDILPDTCTGVQDHGWKSRLVVKWSALTILKFFISIIYGTLAIILDDIGAETHSVAEVQQNINDYIDGGKDINILHTIIPKLTKTFGSCSASLDSRLPIRSIRIAYWAAQELHNGSHCLICVQVTKMCHKLQLG